ncbi:amidase family protein [Halobacteriales archaeon Cl-PHB]
MPRPPSRERLRELSAEYFAPPSASDLDTFETLAEAWLADHDRVADLAADHRPAPDRLPADLASTWVGDDPGPFLTRCRIPGADAGPLADYDVGVKDNVAVAGVAMTCGSTALEGYVPAHDAVVVERLLDAGATVTGKLTLEAMAYSGSGELADYGEVPNPRDDDYLAGGSSSGCAAAVVDGSVDLAIGTDQSGSIRVPAAWSGCVGHKPTFGLVPYTGGSSLEPTVDHVGPMASSVADCALALDALAGSHPSDSRQGSVPPVDARAALDDPEPLTVGVLDDGFGFAASDPAVTESVRATLDALADAGHAVETVSVPLHDDGFATYNAIVLEAFAALVRDEGVGYYRGGTYDADFASTFAEARRTRADEFPAAMRLTLALGRYLATEYRGSYHASGQSLRGDLTQQYDDALADVDVLAMPTTPQTAHERRDDLDLEARIQRSLDMFQNTAPFNLTGHPAVSVPCPSADDLPVGLSFVGDQFADATVLRAARAVETLG